MINKLKVLSMSQFNEGTAFVKTYSWFLRGLAIIENLMKQEVSNRKLLVKRIGESFLLFTVVSV